MGGGFGFRRPVVARTFEELKVQAEPWAADTPSADPWILYDTRLYTSAATTRLTFFQTAQNDESRSNIEVGGALPFPLFLEVHGIVLDAFPADGSYVSIETASGVGGLLDDIGRLIYSTRPSFELNIAGKGYGPFPLRACSGLGGPDGFAFGTLAAGESEQFAANGPRDMGFFVGGSWTIPPQQSYSITVEWPAAVTLTQGDYELAFGLVGTLYRKVS